MQLSAIISALELKIMQEKYNNEMNFRKGMPIIKIISCNYDGVEAEY